MHNKMWSRVTGICMLILLLASAVPVKAPVLYKRTSDGIPISVEEGLQCSKQPVCQSLLPMKHKSKVRQNRAATAARWL